MTGARQAFWSPSILRRGLLVFVTLAMLFAAILPEASAQSPGKGVEASAGESKPVQSVSIPAARQARNVAIITIKGPIDSDTEQSVRRRMNEAIKAGANAIVFDIDSPGGELGAVLAICTEIKKCPIANTVGWVNPQAYSGGAIIALACREIVITDASTMGDAAPIGITMGGRLNELADTERAKVLAPLLGELVDSARRRGYDEKLVQGFVSLGVELWMVESVEHPGEVLFVDRKEFEILFGSEPSAAAPTLVGPSPRPDGMPKTIKAPEPMSMDEVVKNIQKSMGRRHKGGSGAPVPRPNVPNPEQPDGDATKFIPASPAMSQAMGADASDAIETPSGRPILSVDKDRGKWKLVEYVSDGRSLYTLKERQLFDYRLAARGATKNGTVNNDEELKAFFGASNLARLDRNALEATASFLNNILVKGILVAIFLVGFFIELIHPGLILPGSAAAVALVLLVTPAIILGLGAWWQVGAILLGIIMLGVEVFILPGFGVFGVLGLLSLFGGLIGTFTIGGAMFPDSPGRGDLLYAVLTMLVATATSVGVVYGVAKHIGQMPMISRLVLHSAPAEEGVLTAMGGSDAPVAVGEEGVAISPLRPSGRAQFGDIIADVTSESGYIAPGQSVRVIEASLFRIVVEPSIGTSREGREPERGGKAGMGGGGGIG